MPFRAGSVGRKASQAYVVRHMFQLSHNSIIAVTLQKARSNNKPDVSGDRESGDERKTE